MSIDLRNGHFLIAGPNRSGKSTALATIAQNLREADQELGLYLFAPRRSPLTDLEVWTQAARGSSECNDLAAELREAVDFREFDAAPMVIVIDDGQDLSDSAAEMDLDTIARRGRDVGVYLVGAAESTSAHRAYSGWIPEVKKDRHGILLQPDPDMDGDILGIQLSRSSRNFPVGRGILGALGVAAPIHVAM